MADKTYKLNISKSDGSFSDSVQFTIPQREGTYKVEFELSNGNKVNAGSINVSTVEKTYKAEFQLSDGNTIDGGTFTTPVIQSWHTVWSGRERHNFSAGSFDYQNLSEFTGNVETDKVRISGDYNFSSDGFEIPRSFYNEILSTSNREIARHSEGSTKSKTMFVSAGIENGKIKILGVASSKSSPVKPESYKPCYVTITKIEQFY